jgi:CBS domain containing-hemolysin-like protein
MQTAAQQVTDSMTPVDRVLGVSDQTERERLLDYARRFGLSSVLVRRDEDERSWYGYVRVLDAAVTGQSVSGMIRETPQIPHTLSKLEALLILRHAEALHGQVRDGDRLVGIVSERGLIEQLFRPPKTATPRFPVPR